MLRSAIDDTTPKGLSTVEMKNVHSFLKQKPVHQTENK